MPEEKTIHDLPIAEQVTSSDVFETEIPSQLMQSGFASRKVSLSELEEHILGDEQYSTGLPNFPAGSRTIFGALEYARQSGGGGGASVIQKTQAEYDILTTEQKMNGSIYKITDKALIYCLDEEYHAVKEITSADYALLTSDEKNNGTLYVITDEETTADDIEYTSGVSVADKLDELDNKVEVLTVTDKYSSATINAYKSGKVVNIICTVSSIAGGSWVNLGKVAVAPPKQQVSLIALNGSLNVFGQLIINTDGTIQMYHSDIATQGFFNMNISYITD